MIIIVIQPIFSALLAFKALRWTLKALWLALNEFTGLNMTIFRLLMSIMPSKWVVLLYWYQFNCTWLITGRSSPPLMTTLLLNGMVFPNPLSSMLKRFALEILFSVITSCSIWYQCMYYYLIMIIYNNKFKIQTSIYYS